MSSINISTVLKRLEAVTSRLEDLYEHSGKGAPPSSSVPTPASTTTTAATTAPVPPPVPVQTQVTEDPRSVVAYYEQILKGRVQPFVKLTEVFPNASVIEQAKLVERLYTNLGGIIRIAAICKKPDQAAFAELLSDLQGDIEAISSIKDSNRKDRDWFNHLSLVAEGSPAVAWITVENKPGPYVTEIKDATQFYGNRIIKEFKEKDKTHVEWVRAFTTIFDDMKQYVMEHHTTGLVWNAKGISISEYKAAAPPSAAAGGVPPPPPPPPPPGPPPPPALSTAPTAAPAGGVAAVFAELNRGSEVTKSLRKVDKSEMTHKNPALRASSTVPSTVGSSGSPGSPGSSAAPKKPVRPAKPHALMGKKPAKFALEGNKWAIEFQENEAALTLEKAELSQVVNLFGCKNSTILIKGKVNAVTIINCTKTSVLVESVIASVSVTNSPSFTLQITGSAPTIQLDSTDSGQIFLSKDCLSAEITTAKCSSINISLPVEGEEDGIFDEKPVPEMLLTKIQDGKLVTTVVEHVGVVENVDGQPTIRKPKNARSKRALEARESKEVEDPRTVIFVRGTHTGEVVNGVMKDLMALKRPHAISFSKKNVVRPFEDATSLEFWAHKNDASMFLLGQSTKKRPNGLTIARMFNGRLLDMCELGVDQFVSMDEFKTPKPQPGHKPMLHFASELFDTHPRFIQLKSLLMDLFNGEVIESIYLSGLEHVISITVAPSSEKLASVPDAQTEGPLPAVHIRGYTTKLLASGQRVPRVELVPMGPSLDLSLRRHQSADPELWKAALRRPKLKKQDVEKGLGKKRKNLEVDEMGDLRGRVHVAKQDLTKLQTRKMKGLKSAPGEDESEVEGDDGSRPAQRQKTS